MRDGSVKPEPEGTNAALIAVVSLVSAVLTFVVVVGLQALYYRFEAREFERKVVEGVPEELRSIRSEQNDVLNGYRWIDQEAGIVAIPIERAMDLMVRESRGPVEDSRP